MWASLLLVVVDDLDIFGPGVTPGEDDSKLLVDADRMLALPVSCERFEAVTRRDSQVLELFGRVELGQLAVCDLGERCESRDASAVPELLGGPVCKRLNHSPSVSLLGTFCKTELMSVGRALPTATCRYQRRTLDILRSVGPRPPATTARID